MNEGVNVQIEPTKGIYLFLAKCFSYPEEGFCERLKGSAVQEDLRVLVDGLPFEVRFNGLPSPALSQDDLESGYITTFDLNPACPLYESEYRDDDLAHRNLVEELFRFYEYFGVRLADKGKDYPDHLVAELEFMAFLAEREAGASGGEKDPSPYRLAQHAFFDKHLNK